ncbi:MAG: acetyl-CoA carboxylase biotin carboxyl carrier protein subunit, partial [Spirochaetales bacterium]|nr:acetyl-CoA carboxylase biotin carboxyl carrier protein subunit [Spirochaetales bacterium]
QSRETADASSAAAAAGNEIITAPLVGTFYRTPSPDSPPYVEKGSKIKEGDTLCIIEAMKLMNKLEAEFDCEVIRIYPQQGDMVEFGAALFEVKRI